MSPMTFLYCHEITASYSRSSNNVEIVRYCDDSCGNAPSTTGKFTSVRYSCVTAARTWKFPVGNRLSQLVLAYSWLFTWYSGTYGSPAGHFIATTSTPNPFHSFPRNVAKVARRATLTSVYSVS